MGTTNFLFSSVTRWCKKFKSGVDSAEDAPHARRPKTATSQKIVEKVTNLVTSDARFATRHIAICVGISVGAAHTILMRDLKMRRISARWIPHLVTKEQTLARVRIANNCWNSSLNTTIDLSQIPSLAMRRGFTFTSTSERYRTNMGNQRRQKTLHSKTHHEHQKGNVCNFLHKSRSCYSDCRTKG